MGEFGTIVHIKGFGSGVKVPGWQDQAMEYLFHREVCDTLAWDGDSIKDDCFTGLLPKALLQNPNVKAVAFKEKNKIKTFQDKLSPLLDYMDRVFIVSIDVTDGKRRFGLESDVGH